METKHDCTAWLAGGSVQCSPLSSATRHPHRLLLLGAPGVGKGTQAELLCGAFGTCHLSTGDVFRAAKTQDPCSRTPALSEALDYMKHGHLVPDETVLHMVSERAQCLKCQGGFILDGFPRTLPQAVALDRLLSGAGIGLDAVISYDLPFEQIVLRFIGRRTCSVCKAVFHVDARPPKKEGACDRCGGALFHREDDNPASVHVRMEAYETSSTPLVHYYEDRHVMVHVSAAGTPEEVFARTLSMLEDHPDFPARR